MCGIIGYKGNGNATDIVLNGLKKLEYRGYDSWGICCLSDSGLNIVKKVGKISGVESIALPKSNIGFGQSRWATHGKVTEANAHPHLDCTGEIAVVHNGIIENFSKLKEGLVKRGHKFRSETDTEVIPHLIEENLKTSDLEKAVINIFPLLEGRNAFLVLRKGFEGIIGVRKGSPLIVGANENSKEFFIASDIPAFLEHTRQVIYLDDNEMVVIREKPTFINVETGKELWKRIITIEWDAKQAELGEYPHFMIKEIMEQKETLRKSINQSDDEIMRIADEINNAFGTFLLGCGTAGKVCLFAEYAFSKVAKKHINFVIASEFPNYEDFLTNKSLIIAVSQSGETADVLEAIETAKRKGSKVISLVNVMGSSVMRKSDHTFLINAGPEKCVLATKSATSQMALLTLLAYACAGKLDEGKRLLIDTAGKVNDMLNPRYEDRVKQLAEKIYREPNIYIIGRGPDYPMALEAAIKIMEVSYIHAQGFAGGELKHGPIALIENGSPCIVLFGNDETKQEILSNAIEVKARGGYIIGVGPENNPVFDWWMKTPDAGIVSPIVNIIPVQLLAYHLAVLRGCDTDKPRNLAKSVVVK